MPELEIEIVCCDNKTYIRFLMGTSTFKYSLPESVQVGYYISFTEIKNIIDFILGDHEIVKNIAMNNAGDFELRFAINWTDKSIKGIGCDDIKLRMRIDDIDLRNLSIYS